MQLHLMRFAEAVRFVKLLSIPSGAQFCVVIGLEPMGSKSKLLSLPYHLLIVNPAKLSSVNYADVHSREDCLREVFVIEIYVSVLNVIPWPGITVNSSKPKEDFESYGARP